MIPEQELETHIRHAPDLPGVYMFRDAGAEILYVGKALSLRKRLFNYLPAIRGEDYARDSKVLEMAGRARTVEWIVASSEVEALLLEYNLIKRHRPPFNIRLRDDKSYPYIVITLTDEFPRVMFTRQQHRKGYVYFGPYGSAAKVRESLDILGRIFPFRKCRGAKPGRKSGSPCLQYYIKRCQAPCAGHISVEEYREIIDAVVDFFEGRHRQVERRLEGLMRSAAEVTDFERAAVYRDRIEALRHVLERQQARAATLGNADLIGMARDRHGANIQLFVTRDGILSDRRSFSLENVEEAGDEEILERFIGEYYGGAVTIPPEMIVPRFMADTAKIAAFLEGLRGSQVTVRHAGRGDKRRLLDLAERNAVLALEHDRLREERTREHRYGALTALRDVLSLERPPLRIEGYDISNLGPDHIVASMVVMEGGTPKKSDYRKFAVRGVAGQDDVGALREALWRRFTRSAVRDVAAEYDPSFEAVPDLVVLDGGKGQLNAVLSVLEELGLDEVVPVISLAKREEEVFQPRRSQALRLRKDDPALLLLRRLRDEAHRFAVSYHRTRRGAAATASILDGLPGVGERRKQAILRHFGSPERFLGASREELEQVPGLPAKVGRRIYDYVHKTG